MGLFGSSMILIIRFLLNGINIDYDESFNAGQKLTVIHFSLDKFDFVSLYIYFLFLALILGIDNYTLGKLLEHIPILREFAQKMGGVRRADKVASNSSRETKEEDE